MTLNEFLIGVAELLDHDAYWLSSEEQHFVDELKGEPMKSAAEAARAFAAGEPETHADIQRFERNLAAFRENWSRPDGVRGWTAYETSGREVGPR